MAMSALGLLPLGDFDLGQLAVRLEYDALLLGFDDDEDDEADGDDWVDLLSVGVTWTF